MAGLHEPERKIFSGSRVESEGDRLMQCWDLFGVYSLPDLLDARFWPGLSVARKPICRYRDRSRFALEDERQPIGYREMFAGPSAWGHLHWTKVQSRAPLSAVHVPRTHNKDNNL